VALSRRQTDMTKFLSMLGMRRVRLSPPMIVAALALFIALGGTSIAAIKAMLPKNSVGSAQVINGSLLQADISKKTLVALRGNQGEEGPNGEQGRQGGTGAQGPQGAPGAKGDTGTIGVTGAAGAKGDTGTIGATGAAGPAGTAIATHVRDAGSITTTNVDASWPLTGDSWTQGAAATNLIYGQVTVHSPATCASSGGEDFRLSLSIDGSPPTYLSAGAVREVLPVMPIDFYPQAFIPSGVDRPHLLTASVRDWCTSGQHYTLQSLKIEVISLS
jgi:hypothetical protein